MIQAFKNHMLSILPEITDKDLQVMLEACELKTLDKKEHILKEGDVCSHKIFIYKGLLRNYSKAENGNEYIIRFIDAGKWCIDPESYFSGLPSKYNIEAIVASEIAMFTPKQIESLCKKIPALQVYFKSLFQETVKNIQNQILISISATPEEKYLDFMKTHPKIFQKVPLHMIASYLGISRETLTRVRHKLLIG
ncbi:Crp/Fnr family transcriptional regulator [Zhouia sp. PK063]|uniref:Crp/Fnr family transcriptional regulator n=1 Tax=Zhouia sp. PK063 TaxID=3373602 RepID=UPI003795EDD3